MKYLYIWNNHFGKTCFGITSDSERRRRKYEGHCGFEVTWTELYQGPTNHIEDLETRIKTEFWDHLFFTSSGKYEWINETIPVEQVLNWIDWEIENTYNNQIQKGNKV